MATIEYKGIKIFAFSDTHHLHDKLEIPKDIDISICVGDVESEIGTSSLDEFAYWYSKFRLKPNCLYLVITICRLSLNRTLHHIYSDNMEFNGYKSML